MQVIVPPPTFPHRECEARKNQPVASRAKVKAAHPHYLNREGPPQRGEEVLIAPTE